MKAISLWQPWASAIALGYKTIETRGWSSWHLGPVVIHAAKRMTREQQEFIRDVLRPLGIAIPYTMPLGAIVATARIVQVERTERMTDISPVERALGDYTPGRYAWILADVRPLPRAITFRGAQGFFDVPDDLLPEDRTR